MGTSFFRLLQLHHSISWQTYVSDPLENSAVPNPNGNDNVEIEVIITSYPGILEVFIILLIIRFCIVYYQLHCTKYYYDSI